MLVRPSKRQTVIIILGGGLFAIIIALIQLFSFNPKNTQQPIPAQTTTVPTALSLPTGITPTGFTRDTFEDTFVDKKATVGSMPLTTKEQALQEAQPQVFPGHDPTQNGTLIVTSEMDPVTVLLDIPSGDNHHAPSDRQFPPNTTPFKLTTMPAGYYTLAAAKENYVYSWIVVRVEPNKITRLTIHLDPLDAASGY